MGRWAQRTRSGGGTPPASSLIILLSGSDDGFTEVRANFSAPVDSADFTGGDFTLQPFLSNPNTIFQGDPPELILSFDDASAATGLDYSGAAPNVASPQHVDF